MDKIPLTVSWNVKVSTVETGMERSTILSAIFSVPSTHPCGVKCIMKYSSDNMIFFH